MNKTQILKELNVELRDIRAKIRSLQGDEKQVVDVLRVLSKAKKVASTSAKKHKWKPEELTEFQKGIYDTIEDLNKHGKKSRSRDIQAVLVKDEVFDTCGVSESSMSPTLLRLRQKGLVVFHEGVQKGEGQYVSQNYAKYVK